MTDTEFLNWIADRFVYRYGESENVDFVQRLREIARKLDPTAPPVPEEPHPEFQFSNEGADWMDVNMPEAPAPEEPKHNGWSGQPHPGRHF